jgi:cation:H+ antiporter
VHVARHYQVSDFFIGVCILAIGSDMPEIVVSVAAAIRQLGGQETANLIVGNALGSCLAQFGLVMGAAGLLGHLSLPRPQLLVHGAVLMASMILLAAFGYDGTVNRFEGVMLTAAFAGYFLFLIRDEGIVDKARQAANGRMGSVWMRLLLGLLVVVASAELIVRSAMELARLWEVDQSYIGIVIIGLGTSLPELMISIGAVLRARMGLTVGNLIGSNILDVLLPIGLAAVIVPIRFAAELLTFDLPVLAALSLTALLFLLRWGIRRVQGALLLLAYGAYLVVISAVL